MTDPRRKRHINAPSAPKKKEASPNSYKMSRPAEGRKEVPKPKPEPSRPEGRQQQGNRSSGQRTGRSQGGRQGGDRRGGRNQQGGRPRQAKPERPKALTGEDWARVIEHDTKEDVVTAMSEKTLGFCRLKVKSGGELLIPSQRLYIGLDSGQRKEVVSILGMARRDRMSNMAKMDMPLVVQMFVEEHAQYFVDEFYNKAGPISLKVHGFELLPDVGKKKASQMVEARNAVGVFASVEELNTACNIDAAELLARRFVSELEDPAMAPRLTELLLPVEV